MKKLLFAVAIICLFVACGRNSGQDEAVAEPVKECPLGFDTDLFSRDSCVVQEGETFSALMNRLGMNSTDVYALVEKCDTVFNVRKFRAGNKVSAYYSEDSTYKALEYVVYEKDKISSAIFKCKDSLAVWSYSKPVIVEEKFSDVTIKTSLWNDMIDAGASPMLIVELADVYAWTVDFFGLRENDRFRAFYRQRLVDGEVIDIQGIDFAVFTRGNSNTYAILYDQGDKGNKYWNEKGESMKKAFLKAPLKFNRVSSVFSYHRKHPVTGKVRPHTGVDYAAPSGTPVLALGDGTVLSAGWGGGGGNTIKIRHNSVYTTGYLHLRAFASGIKAGARVRQGQVIGYVGSTGVSTGPHLDFRVWKNGTPIDPLKMDSPSAEPIKSTNKPALDSLFAKYSSRLNAN